METKIRLATEADAPTLARLRLELRSTATPVETETDFLDRCTSWMRARLSSNTTWRVWIAERDQTPLGNVWAQLVEKIPNPSSETESFVYLTNFYVREAHRGQGIGTQLLSAVLDWSKANNAHTIILWPREQSKTLYARHGFTAADDLMQLG
jgi:GNAT superfamily N-acetyltransferase